MEWLLEFLGEALLTSMGGMLKEVIADAAKHNPHDKKFVQFLKRTASGTDATLQFDQQQRLLMSAKDKFIEAITWIISRQMMAHVDDKTSKQQPGVLEPLAFVVSSSSHNVEPQTMHVKLFETALKMLENEEITNLATVIFDSNDVEVTKTTDNFKTAKDGFVECWRNTEDFHIYYRLSALRMAFFCDVYHRLFFYKNLHGSVVNQYWAYILPQLARSIHKPNMVSRILPKCIRKGNDVSNVQLQNFAAEMLRFTDLRPDQIVKIKGDQQLEHVRELDRKETNVSDWLREARNRQLSSKLQLLTIIKQPTAIVDSMIKAKYRDRFTKYNPFYFDLKFQFDMNSWIPITLISPEQSKSKGRDIDPFESIENGLNSCHIIVITGGPGAGKTTLTQKMAYDYAKSDENKWGKYDLVLLTEFRSTSDRKHETIIDMALGGLEKIGLKQNVINFIKENVNKYKILIILDGYDESVACQCQELDDILLSGIQKQLNFDLIVTTRPTKVIHQKAKVTSLEISGFDTEAKKRCYIKMHFKANEESQKDKEIESVMEKIEKNTSYNEMAATPLLLAFICFVHSDLNIGTRVELYENVVRWFVTRKLKEYPNLLAELDIGGNYIGISTDEMRADAKISKATRWWNLELMKQLGYLSLTGSVDRKYQFDVDESENIHPNIINVFTKIGLLIGDTQRSIGEQTIKKYQFAHRTLQEYFAGMFMVIWKDEYYRRFPLLANIQNINPADELSKFIIEILLAKRDSKYIQSVEQYLKEIKDISFEIHSNDIDKSWKQINYINDILQKCPNIESVRIDLHKISVNNTIKLKLPNIDYIEVRISNGLFPNNQSNIISISGPNQIKINIKECYLSVSGLILFAEYINNNNNAERFNSIYFWNISLTEADMININKLKSIYFKQYSGGLVIDNLQLDSTQSTEYLNTYIINLSILQLFLGIKRLDLELPLNDKMNDNLYLLQQSIEYSSDMNNLSTLSLGCDNDKTSIGKTYWTCINRIIQKCPNIRTIEIGLFKLHNISIDEPIDLHFLSLKHHIQLDIWCVTFTDNDSNMICINGKVQQINIKFWNCKYSYRRLISFANYINQNSQLFNKIEFTRVSDKDVFDAVFKNTKFDHIAIKRSESDEYSIVKQ